MTKPREIVSVHDMVDDVDEAIALDRRTFIKGVGFAVLTVQCLPLIAHASGNSPSDGNEAADNLIIQSSSGFVPHVHDLLVPYAVLNCDRAGKAIGPHSGGIGNGRGACPGTRR